MLMTDSYIFAQTGELGFTITAPTFVSDSDDETEPIAAVLAIDVEPFDNLDRFYEFKEDQDAKYIVFNNDENFQYGNYYESNFYELAKQAFPENYEITIGTIYNSTFRLFMDYESEE